MDFVMLADMVPVVTSVDNNIKDNYRGGANTPAQL